MANLRKGTTVGGYPIVTEADQSDHTHHVSEIEGLGDIAQSEDGPGSGFDADMLNGNHYIDMDNVWVNKSGDTIQSSVEITGDLRDAPDNAAVNLSYINAFITKNTIVQSEAIPYVAVDSNFNLTRSGNTISASAGDILIGGYFYRYNTLTVNANTDPGVSPSGTYYLYLALSNDDITLEIDSDNEAYGYYRILVGVFSVDGSGDINMLRTYPKPSNLGQIIIISDEPRPNSIINSNSTITSLDEGWYGIRDGDRVDSISLHGDTIVSSGSVVEYKITDFDSLSTYSVSSDSGAVQQNGDTLSFTAPVVMIDSFATIQVTRNQTTQTFRVQILS